jgi:CRISPR-associated protein Csd1
VTILQALDRYYGRMAARGEAEVSGYSREKIGFAIVLAADGRPIDKIDLRDLTGKKPRPRLLEVPAAVKRTAGILPNLLWDKTAYALGRTAGAGRRTADEHAAFKATHLELLANADDDGLLALRRFIETWAPDRFDTSPFTEEMLDSNIVFRLEGDNRLIHEREAARRLLAGRTGNDGPKRFCLITGIDAPVQRLHPTIKGVEGAQSSGAALVSFNLDAFTSYGQEQGDNAPTSEAAAFRYGAALNRMLDRDGPNRLPRPVGDATVIFWADASGVGEDVAKAAEDLFAGWLNPTDEERDPDKLDRDGGAVARLRDALRDVAAGRPLKAIDPRLDEGVRFHVLGLAPNAARLSVRYWLDDRFEAFARRLADHYDDLAIEPKPWRATPPSVSRLLVKTTALQEKFDNIPPLLAGEVMRAVLGGGRYPRTLLVTAIIRLRAGDDPATGWHAAAIRAVLARDHRLKYEKEQTPMSLDRENPNPAYQLGRMFAALETAQRMALGKVNATIRDRYFGAASAAPASVFPLLLRGVQSHLGKLRKQGKGGWIEREIEDITDHLPPELPRSLRLEAQGRFAIGYYHQRKAQFAGRPAEEIENDEETDDE